MDPKFAPVIDSRNELPPATSSGIGFSTGMGRPATEKLVDCGRAPNSAVSVEGELSLIAKETVAVP
jgi:hypothetical protein